MPQKAEEKKAEPTLRETRPATFLPKSYVTDETLWKVTLLEEERVNALGSVTEPLT